MCGIIGICGSIQEKDLEWLNIGSLRLRHRGPDSHGIWVGPKNNIALGHRRLSIIDTSDGSNQPFISNDGKLIIVFNGEIYNYVELREKLKNYGIKFHTNGDTEVLLAAYEHWDEDCLQYLNGMWAFAIYDQRRGSGYERLFVARDRVGEKPFYYHHHSRRFEFASELKGLNINSEVDLNALNHYFALGFIPGELCINSRVKKLPPAHAGMYDFKNGQFRKWRYWDLPAAKNSGINEIPIEQLSQQSWNLLTDSVKLRLRSDVPTGIFLSGGIDSSLITAAAASVSSKRIKTFTASIAGSLLDETKHAKLIANAFGTEHTVLSIDALSLNLLDELKFFIDEPIADSSIIPSFMISRITRKHVTVALGGDGGDELYGGYLHYQNAIRNQAYLGWLPIPLYKFIAQLASSLPAGTKGRNFISSLKGGPLQSSVWGSSYFDLALRKRLFTPELLSELGDEIDAPERRSLALYQEGSDPIDKLTRMDFKQVLTDDFLVKVDRVSMANGLEVRTPFLDYRLVEHAFKEISGEQKLTITERRRVQNLMAKKYLPKTFELKRKQGFSVPMDAWIKDIPLKDSILTTQNNYFNEDFINELIIGQSSKKKNGARLFSLIMFNLINNK
jgi:asparagine synthase (glutamine-hydrolysing)